VAIVSHPSLPRNGFSPASMPMMPTNGCEIPISYNR
jgi:hypothetical protein